MRGALKLLGYIFVWRCVVMGSFPAFADTIPTRIALVIGNQNYQNIIALENPVNDASAFVEKLMQRGFESKNIIAKYDVKKSEVDALLAEFRGRVSKAGPNAQAVFYYAGHGVEFDHRMFFLPVEIPADVTDDTLEYKATEFKGILNAMAGAKVQLAFIDACRTNPLPKTRKSTRGMGGGFGENAPKGVLISYAASANETSQDGDKSTQGHGFYTYNLLKVMDAPDTTIESALKQVIISTQKLSQEKQNPWQEGNLTGEFCFVSCPKGGSAESMNTNVVKPFEPSTAAQMEIAFWDGVKDSHNPAQLQAYVRKYPEGQFVELAKLKLQELTARPETKSGTITQANSSGGAYQASPALYNAKREEAEATLSRIAELDAKTRCAQGFGNLMRLRNDATEQEKSRNFDTAGKLYEQIGGSAAAIESYLTVTNMMTASYQKLNAARASANKSRSISMKSTYSSVYKNNFEQLLSNLAEAQKRGQNVDSSELRTIETQMETFAQQEDYLNATERAIEGYNRALEILKKLTGQYVGAPIPKEERIAGFKRAQENLPMIESKPDTSGIDNSPASRACKSG